MDYSPELGAVSADDVDNLDCGARENDMFHRAAAVAPVLAVVNHLDAIFSGTPDLGTPATLPRKHNKQLLKIVTYCNINADFIGVSHKFAPLIHATPHLTFSFRRFTFCQQ